MASTTCGYCGHLAHMAAASGLHVIADRVGSGSTLTATYKCPNCLRLNVAASWVEFHGSESNVFPTSEADAFTWHYADWLPRYRDVREFPDVPVHIASAASEATLCLSVGAYRAVGSLARAVIEATAKDKGAQGGNLAARINALQDANHVRPHTKEQAHEIRHFGNDMAHGDFVDPVEKEEAEEIVELMVEVLEEVYQSPARLQKRKAARLEKKGEA